MQAQAVLPGFMPTPLLPGDPHGLPIGRWFFGYSATGANALVAGWPSQDLHLAAGPQNGNLATASLTSSSLGAKLALASSGVAATRLAAQASARDALCPASRWTPPALAWRWRRWAH